MDLIHYLFTPLILFVTSHEKIRLKYTKYTLSNSLNYLTFSASYTDSVNCIA